MTSNCITTNIVSDSQNFTLRLSDCSTIDDTHDLIKENKEEQNNDVIVISDSSYDSSSPSSSNRPNWKSISIPKSKDERISEHQEVHILETSCSSDEEKLNPSWRKLLRPDSKFLNKRYVKRNNERSDKVFCTSDETTASSSDTNSECRNQNIRINDQKSCESPTLKFTKQNIKKSNVDTHKGFKTYNSKQTNQVTGQNHAGSLNFNRLNKFPNCDSPQTNVKGQMKLTKSDANKILRNIKSTQVVYNSPREKKETNVIIDESLDTEEDIMHPAISPKITKKINFDEDPDIINTSENDNIIPTSQKDFVKPNKTHISRFLNTSREENLYRPLSESKKKQIAQWLLANSSDSQSDSSCSNIPPSVRNSTGSGNSSLDRLEMNYETPNNRGKISKVYINKKQTPNTDCNKITQTLTTRQTTMDKFLKKTKTNDSEVCTPDRSKLLSKTCTKKKIFSPVTNTTDNMDIMDCTDILDKLYGISWRDKVNTLLPTSEPRKKMVHTTSRAIQTERKRTSRNEYPIIDSDSDTCAPVKNNPEMHQRKKIQTMHKRQDSFINDQSSSDSGSESMYHTALTNPRISTNSSVPKPMPLSAPMQRLLMICDTDIEDENDKCNSNFQNDLRRKKLSFSDDESSTTSEFDPGDYIPPKHMGKGPIKTPQVSKSASKFESSVMNKPASHKSFLASLSNIVPINNAHPDTKKYRLDYKNTKEELCKKLYKLYNEKVFDNKLPPDMSIEWNVRMRGTAGFCYNKKSVKSITGVVKSSRIVLATKILDTPDRIRDTLIHEMCHAAAWLINDVSDGHGPFWTGWANKAMKTFPELPTIRRCHDYEIKTKFTYRCIGCGYSIGRHSKSLDIERKRCGHCYGKFELLINKTTKSGTVQVQTPKKEPSGFALYVKQNYNTVKKERNIKHADVMKILGQQFSAIKIAKNNVLDIDNNTE